MYEGNIRVGTGRTLWQEPSGRWGVAICKDMDFPRLSREYGNSGAALMLEPAWDFGVDGCSQGRMAILRGVESGFRVARVPKDGLLTVSDSRARVLADTSSSSAPFAAVLADVPVRHQPTFYLRVGDRFSWLNLCLLVCIRGTFQERLEQTPAFASVCRSALRIGRS